MSDKFLCYLINNLVDEGANVSSETTYLIVGLMRLLENMLIDV